ncbi:hypothetical protein SAMD00019534_115340 [Acytostelium subglobosum LB1]|uniref:hypothetical protein n=1 Tax=Acytostelium subglobosum LB1 TaxID=1410327 RepID=UPI000644E7C5|nr:hypothetical protein SAMD00019534_115340 [Acytostelium subglobosum LB1]GAM28358.1 hypothetical protein SAMD00019534_115340 [Acytostelium subglobosum LB1]|eukprot:XP_012748675.1 hypothetical protein SAMD00019534_115340 [Acytostelium subglobosum LB1]
MSSPITSNGGIKSWKDFEHMRFKFTRLVQKGAFPHCFYHCIIHYLTTSSLDNPLIPRNVQQLRYRISDYLDERHTSNGVPESFGQRLEEINEIQGELNIANWEDFVLSVCENLYPGTLEINALTELFAIWTGQRITIEVFDSAEEEPRVYGAGGEPTSPDIDGGSSSSGSTLKWSLATHKNQYRVLEPITMEQAAASSPPLVAMSSSLPLPSPSHSSPSPRGGTMDGGLVHPKLMRNNMRQLAPSHLETFDDDWEHEVDNCLYLSSSSYEFNSLQYLNRLDIKPRHTLTQVINGDTFVFDKRSSMKLVQPFVMASRPASSDHAGFRSRKTYYVSFRGTADVADVLGDVHMLQKFNGLGSLHGTFYRSADSFPFMQLFKWIQKGCNVVLTGHSGGGAVATIIALRMICEPFISRDLITSRLMCITFGQPLVLDGVFGRYLNSHDSKGKQFHFFHKVDDPIPSLIDSLTTLQIASKASDREYVCERTLMLQDLLDQSSAFVKNILSKIFTNSNLPTTILKDTPSLFTEESTDLMRSLPKLTFFGQYHIISRRALPEAAAGAATLLSTPPPTQQTQIDTLRAWVEEDRVRLERILSSEIANPLKDIDSIEESLSQHLLAHYQQDLMSLSPESAIAAVAKHSTQSYNSIGGMSVMDCQPRIDSISINIVHGNGVIVKLEGPYVSFIGAAGLPGKLPMVQVTINKVNSIEMEYKKEVDIDASTERIKVKFLSIFRSYEDNFFPCKVTNYVVSDLLSMVGSRSAQELLYAAFWVVFLSDQHDAGRLRGIVNRLLSTVPDYYLLFQAIRSEDEYTRSLCKLILCNLKDEQLSRAVTNCHQLGVSLAKIKQYVCGELNKDARDIFGSLPSSNLHTCLEDQLLEINAAAAAAAPDLSNNTSSWNSLLTTYERSKKWLDLFVDFRRLPVLFPDGIIERLLGSISLLPIHNHRSFEEIKKVLTKVFKIDSLPGGLNLSEDFMTELAIYRHFTQRGFSTTNSFDKDLSDQHWALNRPERIMSLYQTMLIHELRIELAVPRVVVAGLKMIGKSTSIEKVFGIPKSHVSGTGLHYGAREEDRTNVPGFYKVGPNVRVIDFPGSDDPDPTIKSIADVAMAIPGICMIFLRCSSLSSHDTYEIVQQFRSASPKRPIVVCVNRVDEWYNDLNIDPDFHDAPNKLVPEELVRKVSFEWRKLTKTLVDRLNVEDYLIPSVIDRKLLSNDQLNRLCRVFEFKEDLNDHRYLASKSPSFLHLPSNIRDIIGDIFSNLKWFNENELKEWRQWSNELNSRIPLKTIILPPPPMSPRQQQQLQQQQQLLQQQHMSQQYQ